jgi:hypothetical protein
VTLPVAGFRLSMMVNPGGFRGRMVSLPMEVWKRANLKRRLPITDG